MLKNIINRSKEQPPPLGWASLPSKELSNLLHAHCRLRFRLWCSGHPHDSLDYRWVSVMLQGGVSRKSASQGLGNAVHREVSHGGTLLLLLHCSREVLREAVGCCCSLLTAVHWKSPVCCRSLPRGTHWNPESTAFLHPPQSLTSCQLARGKYFKGPDPFSQSKQKDWIWN